MMKMSIMEDDSSSMIPFRKHFWQTKGCVQFKIDYSIFYYRNSFELLRTMQFTFFTQIAIGRQNVLGTYWLKKVRLQSRYGWFWPIRL